MKVIAYARSKSTSELLDQIVRAERWAHAHGCQVLRLMDAEFKAGASEYPPWSAVLSACGVGTAEGVVVTALSVLGPDLARNLGRLERAGMRLLVAGGERDAGWDLGASELRFAADVSRAAVDGAETPAQRRRRVCPPRVRVDLDRVPALQARGERLCDIAERLGCSRSTLVRRLRHERASLELGRTP